MRSNPWLHIIAVVFGVILMGGPTWMLTRASEVKPGGQQTPGVSDTSCQVTLTFAHTPESCSLSVLDQPVTLTPDADGFQGTLSVALPPGGEDLLLKAKWPANTPKTAVEVLVKQGNQTLVDKTFWTMGRPKLTDLVTVSPPKP